MWRYIFNRRKGLSHKRSGKNCQDSVLIKENNSFIAAALADGLGSLEYSEEAADVTTNCVVELLLHIECFPEDDKSTEMFKTYIIDSVVESINRRASELRVHQSQMDCTLVFVCIRKSDGLALVGRLGDSAILVIKKDDSVVISESGVSANGTRAVCDRDASAYLFIDTIDTESEDVAGFILCSDGLDNELYIKGSNHVNKAAEKYINTLCDEKPVDEYKKIIDGYINELLEIEDTPFDDDISYAILCRSDATIELPSDPTWLCSCGGRNILQNSYCQYCNMDFVKLYKNIRFKQYGGKSAFFEQINKNPDEERRIIGLPDGEYENKANAGIDDQKRDAADAMWEAFAEKINHKGRVVQVSDDWKEKNDIAIEKKNTTKQKKKSYIFKNKNLKDNNDVENNTYAVTNNMSNKYEQIIKDSDIEVIGENKEEDIETRTNNKEMKKNSKKVRKKIYALVVFFALFVTVGFVLGGVIFGLVFARNNKKTERKYNDLYDRYVMLSDDYEVLSQKIADMEALENEEKNTSEKSQADDLEFLILEDGDTFFGICEDGHPNGKGILIDDGCCYVGNFVDGEKIGRFQRYTISENTCEEIEYFNQ